MLIFVQVWWTIDKNLVSILSIGSGRTNESNGINKKEAWSVWRKEVLKTSGSKVYQKLMSSETPHQKQDHQKLNTSKVMKILRRWRSSEAERIVASKVVQRIQSRLSLKKTWRMKQRLVQMDLKSLDAYSLEKVEKGQLYEVYNHYLHYSILCLQ